MALTAGVCSLATEQLWTTLPKSPYFASPSHLLVTSLIILFGGAIAFLMVWTEFTVIAETSALTFMVAGTFKEIVTGKMMVSAAFLSCTLCHSMEVIFSHAELCGICSHGSCHVPGRRFHNGECNGAHGAGVWGDLLQLL